MPYAGLIRDARDASLTPSTRIRAAFDALFICCLQYGGSDGVPADRDKQFVQAVIEHALSIVSISAGDAALVGSLLDWVLDVAPVGPLPLSPSDAVALAERIHKSMGAK